MVTPRKRNVLDKDDGIANVVAARCFDVPFHQVLQYSVHGIGIENKLVQLFGRDKGG